MRSKSTWARRGSFVSIAGASIVLLTRCSLFVDTDGLDNGDAGATNFDSSASDVVSAQETSTDAANSSDAPIANEAGFPGCDGGHLICETFDQGVGIITSNWSDDTIYGTGLLEIVSDASASSPNSLHSFAFGSADGSASGAALYKTLSLAATHVHCELDVFLKTNGNWQDLSIVYTGARAGDRDSYANLNLGTSFAHISNALEYFDGGGVYSDTPIPNVNVDTWTHASLDLSPGDAGVERLSVSVNGGTPIVQETQTPVGASISEILLGENYSTTGFDSLYDNIVCDATND